MLCPQPGEFTLDCFRHLHYAWQCPYSLKWNPEGSNLDLRRAKAVRWLARGFLSCRTRANRCMSVLTHLLGLSKKFGAKFLQG